MKKTRVALTIAAVLVLTLSIISCRHEIPKGSCDKDPIQLAVIKTDATNNQLNGSIAATATGGAGFQFSLNGAPFQDDGYFGGLEPFRNYNVVARNSWGCTDTAVVSIVVVDPCAGVTVVVTATKTDATAGQANGTITASATGGVDFTYSINGGAFQSSGNFINLAAGTYDVMAKNGSGCIGTTQVIIGATNPCAGITVVVTTTQVNPATGQSNGSITASATGGTGFTYSLNSGTFQTSGSFTGLAAGNYTITAKNASGCTGVTSVALGATNPCAGITVLVTTTQVNPTTGSSNGSITASATGGTGFTYSLNAGAYQSSGTFSGLAAGTYTITAKNSNGCLGSTPVTLTSTSPCASITITVASAIVNTTPCVTPASGKITVTATGSTGFTYNINGGTYQASNIFSALAAGNYTVGVKDANGCSKTAVATVGNVASGPLFAQMRTLISSRCSGSGCHMNGTTTAGYNFDNDCSIVSKWSQINQSCVTYTLVKMPKSPQPLLTAAEKQKITDWITAGHRYTD
jgi:SprB repeat